MRRRLGRPFCRLGPGLSDAAGARDRPHHRGRHHRHHRAPDRAIAHRAARPAIHHREPAGRRQHPRHRGGRACARGRLHAAPGQCGQCHQRDAVRKAQLQFQRRHRAGRGHHPGAPGHAGQSGVSRQDRSRVHRLCQGQSRQDQHGIGRHGIDAACGRRAVQDDGRRRPAACAVSRRGGGDDRSHQRAGPGHVRAGGRAARAPARRPAARRWR